MLLKDLSRREFIGAATIAAVGLPSLFAVDSPSVAAQTPAPYVPPESPRSKVNFNLDWRFLRDDVSGAQSPGFDDTKWTTVSTPHTYNDVDSFRKLIAHSGGDRGTYKGLAWYRKHFKLPADLSGKTIFLEFEGMRQAGDIYLNGKQIGLYENGVTAYGIDITNAVVFGDKENVLAVKVDNRTTYPERASNTPFEWNANDFNPDYGGINRHVWLHITGSIYQTLPLYYGLETTGVYICAGDFDIAKRTCGVAVQSQVKNGSGNRATVELTGVIVDRDGKICAHLDGRSVDMVAEEKTGLTATAGLKDARFWSTDDPYLYTIYTVLNVDGKVVDVEKVVTGFRKVEFKGGAGKGGFYINDKFVYLKGFAQRSSDEWAGLGQAYPDWMHDYTASMIRNCHGNYVRWMHVSPQKVDVAALDRYGIVQACPAGDKERDPDGRQWEQRLEVMRASIVYFRNNPSILMWEAGNHGISGEHMQQMVALRKQWDPAGMRVMGVRDGDQQADLADTPLAEYYGTMIGQDEKTAKLAPGAILHGYSDPRRDRAPLVETEDFRDEGARRYWDEYSPPYFGFKKGPNDTYEHTSESFALAGIGRYWEYWENRISNTDSMHARWSGYASIYFSDSDADGRQDSSEVARVSGKVDAVRLPKEIYYAHRVMQNERPDIHILGHWSYPVGPDAKKTLKMVYVVSNVESVELFLNGKSLGVNKKRENGYVFEFPKVEFMPGSLKAVGSAHGQAVANHELTTAGEAAAIRLTPFVGPQGLHADGQDVALFDVEVVDAKGKRVPCDDARIDFTCTGPGIWRGGYNSGKLDSTNNLYLNTECGINRVAVRSSLTPGTITVAASRKGLTPAEVKVESKPVNLTAGLSTLFPQRL